MCRVLSIWLDQYPTDFEEPEQYPSLHKTISFAKDEVTIENGVNLLQKSEDLLDKLTVRPYECDGKLNVYGLSVFQTHNDAVELICSRLKCCKKIVTASAYLIFCCLFVS